MDQNTYYVNSDELYHYGRKGMKWGQNIFGKKRSASKGRVIVKKKKSLLDRAKEAQAAKKKAKEEAAEAERKKDPRNMSDADLRRAIDRKKLENEYRQYHPKKVSLGKKLASEFLNSAIKPALIEGGRHVLTNMIKQYGDDLLKKNVEPSKMDKLKEKAEIAKLEKTIYDKEKSRLEVEEKKKKAD